MKTIFPLVFSTVKADVLFAAARKPGSLSRSRAREDARETEGELDKGSSGKDTFSRAKARTTSKSGTGKQSSIILPSPADIALVERSKGHVPRQTGRKAGQGKGNGALSANKIGRKTVSARLDTRKADLKSKNLESALDIIAVLFSDVQPSTKRKKFPMPGLQEQSAGLLDEVLQRTRIRHVAFNCDNTQVADAILNTLAEDFGYQVLVTDAGDPEAVSAKRKLDIDDGLELTLPIIYNQLKQGRKIDPKKKTVLAIHTHQGQLENATLTRLSKLLSSPGYENLSLVLIGPNERFEFTKDEESVSRFQVVQLPLKPTDMLSAILARGGNFDKMPLIARWKLKFTVDALKAFFKFEEKVNGKPDLDYILDEFDSLGAFLNRTRKSIKTVTADDIQRFFTERRGLEPGKTKDEEIKKSEYFEFIPPGLIKTRFQDVVGAENGRKELQKAVDAISHPHLQDYMFENDPAGKNKRVLLFGPSGNGKTLMAKALAGETDAAFINCTANFENGLVGGGGKNLKELKQAIGACKQERIVIFMDEIAGIGQRGADETSTHNGTISEMLTLFDGLNAEFQDKKLLFVSAANPINPRAKTAWEMYGMDDAMWKRFGVKVELKNPTQGDIRTLLQRNLDRVPEDMNEPYNLDAIAKLFEGHCSRTVADFTRRVKDDWFSRVPPADRRQLEDNPLEMVDYKNVTVSQADLIRNATAILDENPLPDSVPKLFTLKQLGDDFRRRHAAETAKS